MLAVGVAVFLPAQRAGNVVDDSRQFQRFLCLWGKPLKFPDGLCKRIDFQEMGYIMNVPMIKLDHFFNS